MNIKEEIEQKFNLCSNNQCIEFYLEDFDVEDDRNASNLPCRKVDFEKGEFSIETNGNKVNFLKIDACILFADDGKKCDFAVFNNREFVFVELKEVKNRKNKKNRKRDAYKQLEKTLEIFIQEKKVNFEKYQEKGNLKLAVAVIQSNTNTKFPASTAKSQQQKAHFQTNYQAKLYEGHIYSFDWNL